MAPTKKNPFIDLLLIQGRMSRLFDEAILRQRGGSGEPGYGWYPPVDVYETEDSIILKAELPGIDLKHLSVEVDGNLIAIKGERKFGKDLVKDNYHRMERFYGSFQRVFSLSGNIDKNSVKAFSKDGVVKIIMSKSKVTDTKAVKIQIS